MRTVIFDIDGTLADIAHRRHFVQSKPKNWPAFNRAMKNDIPNSDIIDLLTLMFEGGWTILVASGRSEDEREVTEKWLNEAGIFCIADKHGLSESEPPPMYQKLYMRASGDYRSDDIVKSEILDQMRADGFDPTIAVDDRDQVVKMWREKGLRCLQVAPGNF